ncbi:PhnH: phopsphonate metabolism protein, predicted C-P lyase subunit [Desulfosarcina variabilis str. Montpellier]|uniref:phosphonate C-P lyase system protein PhnH n=1 Tax=Desulfosarcina variabilis TaxID=2300 RepID=UPI003AFA21AA
MTTTWDDADKKNQQTYRHLLESMSRPGRVVKIHLPEEGNGYAAALAIGRCLLDQEVSMGAAGSNAIKRIQDMLVEKTRVRVDGYETADYLFVDDQGIDKGIAVAKRGRIDAPETAATLICFLSDNPACETDRLRVRLTGPGIGSPLGIMPEMPGIGLATFKALAEANADYPLGVDAFFVRATGDLMALPRSTRISVR